MVGTFRRVVCLVTVYPFQSRTRRNGAKSQKKHNTCLGPDLCALLSVAYFLCRFCPTSINLRRWMYPGHCSPTLAQRSQPGRVSSHFTRRCLHRSHALELGTPGMIPVGKRGKEWLMWRNTTHTKVILQRWTSKRGLWPLHH